MSADSLSRLIMPYQLRQLYLQFRNDVSGGLVQLGIEVCLCCVHGEQVGASLAFNDHSIDTESSGCGYGELVISDPHMKNCNFEYFVPGGKSKRRRQ